MKRPLRAVRKMARGTSLIDLLISVAIIAVLFGGIYLVYFSLVTAIANISVRTAATSAIQGELETIRNLPYDEVGTVGGVPAGIIAPSQTVPVGQYTFALNTTILNIDDPFDGTLNGTPPDTNPQDYKQVTVQATCPLCSNYVEVTVTTTVAPPGLESNPAQSGSLFLYAVDANGNPVSGATIDVTNASVTPSIDLTDTTNASGVLELVGVPTSTESYHITATKSGYSTDETYPPGAAGNPNPLKPDATVLAETVTSVTFAIDHVSAMSVVSSDDRCVAVPNVPFSMQGAKLIGTNPDVYKTATTSATGAGGTVTMANLEWDSYTFSLASGTEDLMGTIPLNPLVLDPNATGTFRLIVQPAADPSLLVTAADAASGAGIEGATVTLSNGGFSSSLTTGRASVTQNSWLGGQYTTQSGGIAVSAGGLSLLVNASGTYTPDTNDWLISDTFDLGGSNATLYTLSWQPTTQPSGATATFQLAANNDDATWNFVGPDGTAGTYFTSPSSSIPASLSGNRYFRYKVFLNTTDPSLTPAVNSVSVSFTADCVPPAQVLFTGLPQGTFTATVAAPNYYEATTTVSVNAGATSTVILLNHQ